MLTREGCQARRQRLWDRQPPTLDGIVLADPQDLVYFANYWQPPFTFRSNDAAAILFLSRAGKSILVVDNLLQPFADRAHVDEVVAPPWYRGVESAVSRKAHLIQSCMTALGGQCPAMRGMDVAAVPAGILLEMGPTQSDVESQRPIGPSISGLKRCKDPDELAVLRLSMQAGEAGMAAVLRELRPGMTEMDAYFLAQRAAIEAAGELALVYGDFVSGPRCEQSGGPPTLRKIEAGDLVLLDFSTVIHGYRADFANTFVCGARPTARQGELYEACMEALHAGEQHLKGGVSCQAVDRAVRSAFQTRGLLENFPGHSGHGIGLGHPEAPFIVPQSSDELRPGDVVTLEPGQYIRGVAGMRFERNYLITETGFQLLSHHALTLEAK